MRGARGSRGTRRARAAGTGAGARPGARGWCAGGAHLGGRGAPTVTRPPLLPRLGFGEHRISFALRGSPVNEIVKVSIS